MPTHYVSSASLVLTTPTGGGIVTQDPTKKGSQTNPLLQFNDSLRTTAGILILSMTTPEVQAQLGIVPGSGTTITVNDGHTNADLLAVSTNGPFIYIQVDSLSAQKASTTVARAEQIVRTELAARQQSLNAPKATYISISDVTPPTPPRAKQSAKITTAVGVGIAVIAMGFGIAYISDRVLSSRRAAGAKGRPGRPTAPAAIGRSAANGLGRLTAASPAPPERKPERLPDRSGERKTPDGQYWGLPARRPWEAAEKAGAASTPPAPIAPEDPASVETVAFPVVLDFSEDAESEPAPADRSARGLRLYKGAKPDRPDETEDLDSKSPRTG